MEESMEMVLSETNPTKTILTKNNLLVKNNFHPNPPNNNYHMEYNKKKITSPKDNINNNTNNNNNHNNINNSNNFKTEIYNMETLLPIKIMCLLELPLNNKLREAL